MKSYTNRLFPYVASFLVHLSLFAYIYHISHLDLETGRKVSISNINIEFVDSMGDDKKDAVKKEKSLDAGKVETKTEKKIEIVGTKNLHSPIAKSGIKKLSMDEISQSFKKKKEDITINKLSKGEIRELYKDEVNTLNDTQIAYINENLAKIQGITQRHLRYPEGAAKLRKSGNHIIEFILHKNGNISHLRVVTSTGYTLLDKNSIETIEEAYSEYPRPKLDTPIRFYVRYIL